ncbi:MAG: response regulator [Halobacteriovoraceae bacterium]|nr:response regulator [Halobacteriovoraceae bacterium]
MAILKLEENITFCPLKKHILVIDDDVDVLTLLKASFKNDYDVHCLEGHRNLITTIEKARPEFILLDLNIPHVDGYEILSILSNNPIAIDIPVICMSSDKSSSVRKRVKDNGAIGFIQKPIKRKLALNDIKSYLNTLNVDITNKFGNYRFILAFNNKIRHDYLEEIIFDDVEDDLPKIVCSWESGKNIFENENKLKHIDEESIIYLEMKPALIIKFPYLQDLSPVLHELEEFMNDRSRKYHLILDEPRNFLNVYGGERVFAQSINFINLIKGRFEKITVINSRPHSKDADAFLQKIGKLIVND